MSKKNKTKSSSTSIGTATTTPNVPSFISGPASDYYSQVGSLLQSGPGSFAGPSSLQTQGFNAARNLGAGTAQIGDAANATRGLLNFTPDSVTAGQLRDTDLTGYMNPYTQNVIDAALADIERSRGSAIAGNQAAATQARAYGGSRHGVADSLTNEAALRAVGSTSANLRAEGFRNAQTAALADIQNALAAATGNADRGLAGASVRLGAANQLGQLGEAMDASGRANAALQVGLGAEERDLNDPAQQRIRYLQQLSQLLGIDPRMFTGQTINQSGSSSGTNTQSSSGLSFSDVAAIAQTAAAAYQISDRRTKRDIELIGTDARGLPWYSFAYKWDAPWVRRIGVMADEAPAEAVHIHPSGYAMVRYDLLDGALA